MTRVSFFVVFTPNDAVLAPYTLRSLRRLSRLDFPWDITLFLNGLSEDVEREVSRHARPLKNLTIKSNRASQWKPDIPLGSLVKEDASGLAEMRYCAAETGAEVWTRELPLLSGTYACQLDGDYEVLDIPFLQEMKRAMDQDPKLCVVATSRHETINYWDSYSGDECMLAARADTWCAMWRRECITDPPGFWYREKKDPGGRNTRYDHGAYLQQTLVEKGWRTAGIADITGRPDAAREGIHYGAFALNRSLNGIRLFLYRCCRIAMFNGYRHLHGSEKFAERLRQLGQRAYAALGFASADDERTRYWWQSS